MDSSKFTAGQVHFTNSAFKGLNNQTKTNKFMPLQNLVTLWHNIVVPLWHIYTCWSEQIWKANCTSYILSCQPVVFYWNSNYLIHHGPKQAMVTANVKQQMWHTFSLTNLASPLCTYETRISNTLAILLLFITRFVSSSPSRKWGVIMIKVCMLCELGSQTGDRAVTFINNSIWE